MTDVGGGTSGDERRNRAEALRALAEGAPTAPATPPPPPLGTRRRWPRWLVPLVSAVALLALAAVAVLHLQPSQTQAPKTRAGSPGAPLALDPETYGIACLQDAAWSPDSAQIAILGTEQSCAQPIPFSYSYYPTIVVFVDAATGRRLGQLQPDVTVQRDLHLHAPQYITPMNGAGDSGDLTQQGVSYRGVIWSPDGKRVALPFDLQYASAPAAGGSSEPVITSARGVYIGAVDGSSARAFGATLTTQAPFLDEWNVKTGKPVEPPASLGLVSLVGTVAQLLPPSLTYTWRGDGSLAGSGALNPEQAPARGPLSPVGNPDGGARFTVWQPATIQANAGDPANPQSAAAFEVSSAFLAWSPDGAYLLIASYNWRAQPSKQPVPTAAQLEQEGVANIPLLPVRDAAMDAMLSPPPGGQPLSVIAGGFAWSPDGKLLAALANGGVNGSQANVTVLIADCATGKTLASIKAGSTSAASGNITIGPGLAWAPDGKKLLIGAESELFVVGPGALPQR